MTAFAPTDWNVSDVKVIRNARPWGPNAGKQVAARVAFHTNGASALTYPSAGLPAPPPGHFGFSKAVEYLIPLGPFAPAAFPVDGTLPWSFIPAPTAAPTEPPSIRLYRYAATILVTANEFTTGSVALITPTTNTAGLVAYVIAVGN